MTPQPTSYEQALSQLTFAIGCIERFGPTSKDESDRLNWAVQRLDRAAVKAAGDFRGRE